MLAPVCFALLYAIAQAQLGLALRPTAGAHWCSNNPVGPLSPLVHDTTCSPLVDDETEDWSPWAHPPACASSSDVAQPKLCAFTVASLRGAGSMSIVTTPAVAANLAGSLQDPDVAWLEKQRGSPFQADPRRPYEIRQLPGKGFGVVATQPIRKHDVVMLNLPLLLQIADVTPWRYRDVMMLLQEASTRLPTAQKQALLQMARQNDGYIVDDIMKTNTFQVMVSGVQHSGLYPEIAVGLLINPLGRRDAVCADKVLKLA